LKVGCEKKRKEKKKERKKELKFSQNSFGGDLVVKQLEIQLF
jgi:hypothetical protein